jgi:hypothetical protein
MALQQTVETATGAPVTYWMILREEIDHAAATRTVILAGFVSEAKRRTGRPPAIPLRFVFTSADFPGCEDLAAVPRTALYRAIRAEAKRQSVELSVAEDDPAALPDARAWIAALAAAQDC